uniref:Uncharacterized protein n=1 Tax=Heterorhabditis bacteriophora TaxID=37862 RepID=A0A1I7XQX1_HETBA
MLEVLFHFNINMVLKQQVKPKSIRRAFRTRPSTQIVKIHVESSETVKLYDSIIHCNCDFDPRKVFEEPVVRRKKKENLAVGSLHKSLTGKDEGGTTYDSVTENDDMLETVRQADISERNRIVAEVITAI